MASIPPAAAPTPMPTMAPLERPDELFSLPLGGLDWVGVTLAVVEDDDDDEVEVEDGVAVELIDEVVVVGGDFAAFLNAFSLIVMGVFDVEQALDMVSYTLDTSSASFWPRHCAALMTKPPPLLQRHLFRSGIVDPVHLDASAASYRHGCAFVG